jgi:hypothetical protein
MSDIVDRYEAQFGRNNSQLYPRRYNTVQSQQQQFNRNGNQNFNRKVFTDQRNANKTDQEYKFPNKQNMNVQTPRPVQTTNRERILCTRCGRSNHTANNCYAVTSS